MVGGKSPKRLTILSMYAPDRASNLMWQELIEPKKKWMNPLS